MLNSPDILTHTFALNAIDNVVELAVGPTDGIEQVVIDMVQEAGEMTFQNFDQRVAAGLFDKWEINIEALGVEIHGL